MTDRLTALRELLAKVEAGEFPEAVFHGASVIRGHWAYVTGLTAKQRTDVFLAYNGSLDAALALHEAVLPDCPVKITGHSPDYLGNLGWHALVNWPHTEWREGFTAPGPFSYGAWADTPARALLICDIKALIAQEEGR